MKLKCQGLPFLCSITVIPLMPFQFTAFLVCFQPPWFCLLCYYTLPFLDLVYNLFWTKPFFFQAWIERPSYYFFSCKISSVVGLTAFFLQSSISQKSHAIKDSHSSHAKMQNPEGFVGCSLGTVGVLTVLVALLLCLFVLPQLEKQICL